MAFSNQNQAVVAFKNLLGKSNTDVNKEVGNESEGIFFNIGSEKVWMSIIGPTPSVSVTNGIAIQVTANLVADLTSNGHAFFAQWPATAPAGTDPTTSNPYAYGSGLLTGISSGDRVTDAISPVYGFNYEAKPYDNTVALIPPGDPRDWIYQYNSGIFFQQDIVGNTPATIQLYVYTGELLSNFQGGGGNGLLIKYRITPSETVIVPTYSQYWLYGDLTVEGQMTNHGQVVIANGGLVLAGGTYSDYGQTSFITLGAGASPSQYNDGVNIGFTVQNTIFGPSISAYVIDGSLTASQLNTGSNGGPTAGYLLSVDGSGLFSWVPTSAGATTQPVYQVGLTTSTQYGETGITLSSTPTQFSRIQVFVNGQLQSLGDGITTLDCHFGTTVSAVALSSLSSGDQFVWNDSNAGFQLSLRDRIDIIYEA